MIVLGEGSMHTPVALIIFNRPHHTARVFAEIAKARPERLFLIADGPRPDRPEDVQRCAAVRDIVARVDWPCQVERNFAERNLGCGRRPGSGISWVFEQVDAAMILEDDCVPDPTFFRFCEDLLEKYREDERVMNIGGTNWQCPPPRTESSYFFSIFNITWGWATWRRAWQYYDPAVRLWPEFRDTSWLLDLVRDAHVAQMFAHAFECAYAAQGELDFWDYQWTFTCWAHHGLSILPTTALVENVGFGPEATHTTWMGDVRARLPKGTMGFPLRHPATMVPDRAADQYIIERVILPQVRPQQPSILDRLRRLGGLLPNGVRAGINEMDPPLC
jgi:hypothetical protein